jgi:hypothetical protein
VGSTTAPSPDGSAVLAEQNRVNDGTLRRISRRYTTAGLIATGERDVGDGMVEVLLDASRKLGLGLTRYELLTTPPIRDWIWWKNKEALLTIGDNKPR